eukprot:403367699
MPTIKNDDFTSRLEHYSGLTKNKSNLQIQVDYKKNIKSTQQNNDNKQDLSQITLPLLKNQVSKTPNINSTPLINQKTQVRFSNNKTSNNDLNSNLTSISKIQQRNNNSDIKTQLGKSSINSKSRNQLNSLSHIKTEPSIIKQSPINEDELPQGRSNLHKHERNRLKEKSKINLKLILKIIEKDMEKKLSSKQKVQLKIHKEIAEAIQETKQSKLQSEKLYMKKQLEMGQRRASCLNQFRQSSQQQRIIEESQGDGNTMGFESIQELIIDPRQSISPKSKQLTIVKNLSNPFKMKVQETQEEEVASNQHKSSNVDSQVTVKKSFTSAAEVNSFLLLKQKIHRIQSNQKKIRSSVQNELDRREIGSPLNYLQQRISSIVEDEQHQVTQQRFTKKIKQLDDERKDLGNPKRFQLLPFPHQSEQAEFRQVNLLFTKNEEDQIETMKKYYDDKSPARFKKHQLLNHKDFDLNKYKAISPFQKSRNSFNLTQNGFLSPLRTNDESVQQQTKIEKILKKCTVQHNSLASFCKKQGRKIQRRYDNLEKNQESVLRQIDIAKDLLFMDLCKRQKFREKFRDLVNKSLKEDWLKKAQDIQYQFQTQQLIDYHEGRYSLEMLNNSEIREELWRQFEQEEMEMERLENESLAEHDSFHLGNKFI